MKSGRSFLWSIPFLVMLVAFSVVRAIGPYSPDLVAFLGYGSLVVVPLVVPPWAAAVDGRAQTLGWLLSSMWVSLGLVYVVLAWSTRRNWVEHNFVDMSMMFFPVVAGYVLLCSIVAAIAFLMANRHRHQ